ncbi:MAG: hypothetical protein ACPHAQ_03875 [Ilumatobacteraceae bacterium]
MVIVEHLVGRLGDHEVKAVASHRDVDGR